MTAGPWMRVEHDLAKWMQSFQRPGLEFCAGRKRIPGFPSKGFRADALLTDGDALVALEVEVRQTHPDTNVGKYWLLNRYHQYKSILLFHVYTPAFSSYGWRMELGKFYADEMKMRLPFEYVLLDQRGDTNAEATLQVAKSIMEPRIKATFEPEQTRLTAYRSSVSV